jgi:hypothetical protein
MSLLPFIGYSQAELNAEYQRGLREGQAAGWHWLQTALHQFMPAIAEQLEQCYHPSWEARVQHLIEIWSRQTDQARQLQIRLEAENRQCQSKVEKLEKKWADAQPDQQRDQLYTLITEKVGLFNQVLKLQAKAAEDTRLHSIEVERLQAEINRLEDLVVDYEQHHLLQNAKH